MAPKISTEPAHVEKLALVNDPGTLELILMEAATDKDVLFAVRDLLVNHPMGPWPLYAAKLIKELNRMVDEFYSQNVG